MITTPPTEQKTPFDPNSGNLWDAIRGGLTDRNTLIAALAGAIPAGLLGAVTAARGKPSLRKETPAERRMRIAKQALTYSAIGGLGAGALGLGFNVINNPSPHGGSTGGPVEKAWPSVGGWSGAGIGLVRGSAQAMRGKLSEKYRAAADAQGKGFHEALKKSLSGKLGEAQRASTAKVLSDLGQSTDSASLKAILADGKSSQVLRDAASSLLSKGSQVPVNLSLEQTRKLLALSPTEASIWLNQKVLTDAQGHRITSVDPKYLRSVVAQAETRGIGPKQFYENFRGGDTPIHSRWGSKRMDWNTGKFPVDNPTLRHRLTPKGSVRALHHNNFHQSHVSPILKNTAGGALIGYGSGTALSLIPGASDAIGGAWNRLFGDNKSEGSK